MCVLSVSVSVCMSVFLCVSVCLGFVCVLSVSLCVYICMCISVCVYDSVSVFCMCIWVSLYVWWIHPARNLHVATYGRFVDMAGSRPSPKAHVMV